jgi:competence protein ComEA
MALVRFPCRDPRPCPLRWAALWFAIGLLLSPALPVRAQQQVSADKETAKWETLVGCRLKADEALDGDSFHVLHKDREYIFRLYFVDAPESDATLRDRIQDQAAYFGVSSDVIPFAGEAAADFTRKKLAATNFTVITRWQNAMGRSSLARFYAVVLIGDENLAEELVANGLARIYGLHANWPDGPRSTTFINKLKNLELTAREKKLGVWNTNSFAATTNGAPLTAVAPRTNTPPDAGTLIDLNSATAKELDSLPGIGPVLAERIVEGRPYETVEDLRQVPGIGKATMDRLRPLVRVSTPPTRSTDQP